ncbi:MAG: adenylosuccinate synthase, partial [Deltaproteobacteria bacterium]|nr:adenylosuccinate synthase [Deltaproteobacteria bacterium]
GPNAGHTVVIGEQRCIIRMVPSGIFHPHPLCVLGPGMVIDPIALVEELRHLQSLGIDASPKRIVISQSAHVITPYHILVDSLRESGRRPLGTTQRGVGPAYESKARRHGMRIGDLIDRERCATWLREIYSALVPFFRDVQADPPPFDVVLSSLEEAASVLAPFVGSSSAIIHGALQKNQRILAEGAQGTLLDLDHGTYPYVTSSTAIAGGACVGLGIGPRAIDRVVAVAKSYITRVGHGPMPTEISGPLGELIRKRGHEFGSVTGRPRRCGWLDLPALKYAAQINGATELALTKVDVLRGIDPIRVCVAYRFDGQSLDTLDPWLVDKAEPTYLDIPGFNDEELAPPFSPSLQSLLHLIASYVQIPIRWLGTGPERSSLIELADCFEQLLHH